MHSTPCRRSVSVFAKKFLKVALISTFAYLVTPSGIAMALAYRFTTIDVPGGTFTSPSGVNDTGVIVGSFTDDTGSHGFLYKGGTFATLGPPGASQSYAASINNAGQIVGLFTDSAVWHAFLKVGGAFTTIDFPGADFTSPLAIDNAGRILGFFVSPTRGSYFIAEGSNFTEFFCGDLCFDFNDSGRVVGMTSRDGGDALTPFVADIDGGNFDDLFYPGSFDTTPSGINNTGQIVGTFLDVISWDDMSCCSQRGFINVGGSSGTFIPLDHPAAFRDEAFFLGTEAFNISDSGLIVGAFYDQERRKGHGFLAIPTVPEPASLMLFGVGLLGLSLASWRRYMSFLKYLRYRAVTSGARLRAL